MTALLMPAMTAPTGLELYGEPAGTLAVTLPKYLAVLNNIGLSNGTLSVMSIALRGGILVSNITFTTGGQVKAGGTHGWYCLLNSSRMVVAVTADQTDAATVWGTLNTPYTLPVTVPYLVPVMGLYYLGICVTATTPGQPMGGPNGATGISNSAPALCGTIAGAPAAPPALGTTMAAISAAGVSDRFYAYVS